MLITRSLKNLLDKLFFAGVLLLGIQLPNFVLQYQQSINAHYQEVSDQLLQYQAIADRFYTGDMEQLLQTHQQNAVPAIRAEAKIIADLMDRYAYLQELLYGLQNESLVDKVGSLSGQLDADIAEEVLNHYILAFPLDLQAIYIGVVLALVASVIVQLFFGLVFSLLGKMTGKRPA